MNELLILIANALRNTTYGINAQMAAVPFFDGRQPITFEKIEATIESDDAALQQANGECGPGILIMIPDYAPVQDTTQAGDFLMDVPVGMWVTVNTSDALQGRIQLSHAIICLQKTIYDWRVYHDEDCTLNHIQVESWENFHLETVITEQSDSWVTASVEVTFTIRRLPLPHL